MNNLRKIYKLIERSNNEVLLENLYSELMMDGSITIKKQKIVIESDSAFNNICKMILRRIDEIIIK